MAIYLINLVLIIIYGLCCNNIDNQKIKKRIYILAVMQLIFILGFRLLGTVGKDWIYYSKYYDLQLNWNLAEILNYQRYEIGFKLLTKVLSLIYNNTQFYVFIIGMISIVPVAYIVYKYSKMPFLSLIIYVALDFYTFNFAGLRQGIAIAIIFFAYKYIVENKLSKFICCIILATLFHASAIIFLPIYFIRQIKITKIKIVLFAIIAILIYVFKNQIFIIINSFLYDNYSMSNTNSINWMLLCICMLILCYLFYKAVIKNDKNNQKLYIITTIGCMCMLFSQIASDTMRIANYFYIFIIILIPEVLNCLKNKTTKNTLVIFSIILLAGIYLYLLNIDSYNIVPYKVFF